MTFPKDFRDGVLELLWSLWAELGLRSVRSHHQHLLADPEPLILMSTWFVDHDPRLREEILRWSACHGSWVSKARLRRLYAELDAPWQEQAARFASAVRARNPQVQWPGANSYGSGESASARGRKRKDDALPFDRPAMLRLRLRALVGVGARSDVLAHLLVVPAEAHALADLHYLKYTKSTFVSLLKELSLASHIDRWKAQGSYRYRMRHPQLWATLLGQEPLAAVDLMALGRVLYQLDGVSQLHNKSPRVAQVEASALWARVVDDLRLLGHSPATGPLDLPTLEQRAVSLVAAWAQGDVPSPIMAGSNYSGPSGMSSYGFVLGPHRQMGSGAEGRSRHTIAKRCRDACSGEAAKHKDRQSQGGRPEAPE